MCCWFFVWQSDQTVIVQSWREALLLNIQHFPSQGMPSFLRLSTLVMGRANQCCTHQSLESVILENIPQPYSSVTKAHWNAMAVLPFQWAECCLRTYGGWFSPCIACSDHTTVYLCTLEGESQCVVRAIYCRKKNSHRAESSRCAEYNQLLQGHAADESHKMNTMALQTKGSPLFAVHSSSV